MNQNTQKGAALLLVLIALLVLALATLHSLQDALMQARLSGALQNTHRLRQDVEQIRGQAEQWIHTATEQLELCSKHVPSVHETIKGHYSVEKIAELSQAELLEKNVPNTHTEQTQVEPSDSEYSRIFLLKVVAQGAHNLSLEMLYLYQARHKAVETEISLTQLSWREQYENTP